jgi:hypothetical protein
MKYNVLKKYSSLKTNNEIIQEKINNSMEINSERIFTKFMADYDNDVKTIHNNQKVIDKNLQSLFKESETLINNTKDCISIFNDFTESMKQAGDLFNWASLLDKEINKSFSSFKINN